MTITSFYYLVFIAAGALVYYLMPKSMQWIELLVMSVLFYCTAASPYTLVYLGISTVLAWGGTNLFERLRQNGGDASGKLSKMILLLTIGINILLWFLLKGSYFWKKGLKVLGWFLPEASTLQGVKLVAAFGMGYYTLQVIGYILDCYWETVKPQKNVLKLFLFTAFFPQLVTGPISRYEQLKGLYERHRFSYLNVTHGMQRILWGFFKKLVLAERAWIIVNGIWADTALYNGLYAWIALLLYPIQMYADFSGCMDIVIGTAEMFGIRLAENFDTPFFSKTSQEFWQRWHMTLGSWAKDYVLYPLLKSRMMLKFGKSLKKKLGKRAGKFIATAAGMLVLWTVMGIWHGEAKYIIGVSLWYWTVLMLGELAAPLFSKLMEMLCIRTDNFSWRLFRMARTYLIYALGAVFFRAIGIRKAVAFIKVLLEAFKKEIWNPWILFDGSILKLGVTHQDLNIIVISVLLLLAVGILRKRHGYARNWMDWQSLPFRWMVWIGMFVFVLVYGIYGPGYSASEFIYQGF